MNLADYSSRDVQFASGRGCYLIDASGKRYLDFLAGWCVANIGYGHPSATAAAAEQAAKGFYVPPLFRYQPWEVFASRLCGLATGSLTRAFRCTSGSEAVEFAVKCARAATGRPVIVSVDGVYHGHTYGAASVGDACRGIGPCVPGTKKVPLPDVWRGITEDNTLHELEAVLRKGDVAAFVSEPVWSNAGVFVPSARFYPAVADLCRRHGALLVMDEVATGFGRCGTLFASELWGVKPDIMCLGKGMTGGYGTMGATLVTEDVYRASSDIPYYSTFGWMPHDLAGTAANVEVIVKEKLWEHAADVGSFMRERLKPLEELPHVGQVRGVGMLIGIDIVKDKESKMPDWRRSQRIQQECQDGGLVIETAGNCLFITPPLILTEGQAEEGIAVLERAVRGE